MRLTPRTTTAMLRVLFKVKWITSGLLALATILEPVPSTYAFLFGLLVHSVWLKVLKRAIAQPRPRSAKLKERISAEEYALLGPGMPSSHSANLLFIATFVGWSAYACQHAPDRIDLDRIYDPPLPHPMLNTLANAVRDTNSYAVGISCATVLVVALTLALRRVHSGYHTLAQVLAGCSEGAIVASVYFWYAQHWVRRALFSWLIGSSHTARLLPLGMMITFGILVLDRVYSNRVIRFVRRCCGDSDASSSSTSSSRESRVARRVSSGSN